jgi:hypothetical protein
LALSIVLSLVLTVALNVLVRLFPGRARHVARWFDDVARRGDDESPTSQRAVRLVVPWKTMIAVSVILTVAINVVLWTR